MNYEKRYKEALSKAKDMLSYKEVRQEDMEYLFPELKNNDERIRKTLIDFFSKGAENGEQTNGIYDKDIIAWLEKQGEKPQGKSALEASKEKKIDNANKVEQSSAWSEEDDYNVQCLVAKVTSDIQNGNVGRNQELIDWLKSLKERCTWKPSNIQMECLHDAVEHYHKNGYPASKLNELYEQMSKIYKL